jgi:hypothetical protein
VYPDTDVDDGAIGASAGTSGTFDVTGSGTTATDFIYSLDLPPASSNPPLSEIAHANNNVGSFSVTPPSPGPHTLYGYAVDAAGDHSGTFAYPFMAAAHPSSTCTSLSACYNNTGITSDSDMSAGNLDGGGHSFSATDLNNAGWNSGGKITVDGATLTLPSFGTGGHDNVLADNQTVTYSGSGDALVLHRHGDFPARERQQSDDREPVDVRVFGTDRPDQGHRLDHPAGHGRRRQPARVGPAHLRDGHT